MNFHHLLLGAAIGCMTFAAHAANEPMPGQQQSCSYTFKASSGEERTIRYWLFAPERYKQIDQRWPIMIFLHGAGERGDDLELVKTHGPPKLVGRRTDFPFVLVAPQCAEDAHWEVADIKALLDHLTDNPRLDSNRVYLTGISMGGYGTWDFLAEHSDLIAAAAPVCGGGDPSKAVRFKDIPLWVFHGAKDDAVPLKESEQMIDAILVAGGKPQFTVYASLGHNCWDAAYDTEELYRWFLAQSKRKR